MNLNGKFSPGKKVKTKTFNFYKRNYKVILDEFYSDNELKSNVEFSQK